MKTIGERLKIAREGLSLNRTQFAKQIKLSQPTISLIESGKQAITPSNIKLICHEFGINEDWLLNGGNMSMYTQKGLTPREQGIAKKISKLDGETQDFIEKNIDVYLELQELRKKTKNRVKK